RMGEKIEYFKADRGNDFGRLAAGKAVHKHAPVVAFSNRQASAVVVVGRAERDVSLAALTYALEQGKNLPDRSRAAHAFPAGLVGRAGRNPDSMIRAASVSGIRTQRPTFMVVMRR